MNSEVFFKNNIVIVKFEYINGAYLFIFLQKGDCTTPLSQLPAITQDWVVSA